MINVNMETKDGVILNTNGKYCEDYIQITPSNADAITAQNIKEGVTILGVTGILESSNIGQLISGEITTLNIPDNVTKIRDYAFQKCSNLSTITIPESVTTIGTYAFRNCTSLTNITIPNSVTTIGTYAFSDCTSLTNITIPNSVTTIGSYAFSDCSSLKSITIPNSVTSISSNVFRNCTSLTNVTIENGFNANGLNLSASTKYTHDTILSWLNALYDRTGLDAYKLIIGTTNLNKLTDEEKAIATNKNWTLA